MTEVQQLQAEWKLRRQAWIDEGSPDHSQNQLSFVHIDKKLTDLLWKLAWDVREADRQKHPKARRNQPPPPRDADYPSRQLP